MLQQQFDALVELLHAHGDMSLPRVAKKLQLSQSELLRLIAYSSSDYTPASTHRIIKHVIDGKTILSLLNTDTCESKKIDNGVTTTRIVHIDNEHTSVREEHVIVEQPIGFLYNGLAFAVMMATPDDLEDFALGFSICEDIISDKQHYTLVDIQKHTHGVSLHIAIPQYCFDAIESRKRNLEGRSGCGLCGSDSIDAILRPIDSVLKQTLSIRVRNIFTVLQQMPSMQRINQVAGSSHAAVFVIASEFEAPDTWLLREDVGRHNAVDKVIGAALAASKPMTEGVLFITSRASFEIVQKAATAGIAIIIAISAPTDLAIRMAHEYGITLVAFARSDRNTMNIYTHPQRISDSHTD